MSAIEQNHDNDLIPIDVAVRRLPPSFFFVRIRSNPCGDSSSDDLALLNTVVSHWLAATVIALVQEDVGVLGCGFDSVRHPFRIQLTCLSITS